jgi:hypothetical protein
MENTEPVKLDAFHAHEALDRTYVTCDHFGLFVAEHPFVSQNEDLAKKAEEITASIFDFYQSIANLSYEMFEMDKTDESTG